ncbi:hypothetical protein CG434_22255 [Pantoea ananatis]|nr:hypothetical protein B7764_19645 [Pantoea ananatis]PQK69896.1 hypothetical protein CG428_21565 [Pantoea ananatis]PQK84540.1 hypothetical protein CG432_19900 [Pantoea ananatis]PQK94785.1 hypothetical protein CG434_22255 [Pantoea ananatis]
MASHCLKNWRFRRFSLKKTALGKFIEISPCQPERTPYNAPPLTRHNGIRSAGLSKVQNDSNRSVKQK